LAIILVSLLFCWLVSVGLALVIARSKLDSPNHGLKNEIIARGAALLGATLAISVFSFAASVLTAWSVTLPIFPMAFGICILPLFLPQIVSKTNQVIISSQSWIWLSVIITVLTGLAMALSILVRLIKSAPELI